MISTPTILTWLWVVLGIYWLASALGTKKTEVDESPALRLPRLALLCLMFTLLLTDRLRFGFLGWRLVPDRAGMRWTGVAVTLFGLGLSVWARLHLGTNWSDKVALKVHHQLICSGPYAFLRHPIYSGVLLAIAGSALAIGEWRGIVVLAAMTANYWVKARREERILSERFGGAFAKYREDAGFMVPKW